MSFVEGFKKGFKEFGHNINHIINSALLTLVYLIGVGSTALFAKVKGKHFLDMGSKKTYWSDLNLKKKPKEEYFRQF